MPADAHDVDRALGVIEPFEVPVMSDDKKPPQLFRRRQLVLIAAALVAGVSLNGYRRYRDQGGLDTSWFVGAIVTIVIMAAVVFVVVRHARKPEKEE